MNIKLRKKKPSQQEYHKKLQSFISMNSLKITNDIPKLMK